MSLRHVPKYEVVENLYVIFKDLTKCAQVAKMRISTNYVVWGLLQCRGHADAKSKNEGK